MALKAGIVGLPNVGKSSLFSGITKMRVESANYAFTTIDPNISVVEVNDPRLEVLSKIVKTKREIKATFEFVDIAGLVEGASKGEGLGNKFLSNIREVDLIVHVVRCFHDKNVLHVLNNVDPVRDFKLINFELILADLQVVSNIKNRISRKALNTSDKDLKEELMLVEKLIKAFEREVPARELDLSEKELKLTKNYQLLTIKPMIVVANIDVQYLQNPEKENTYSELKMHLQNTDTELLPLSISIESEIALMNKEDKELFLAEYNLTKSGIDSLIFSALKFLKLKTFFTAGEIETRAWIFKDGMNAAECAGIIHTDFEKKFIRAEVTPYEDFVNFSGEKNAKEAGKLRLEGKHYHMQDGDVVYFRIGK